MEHIIATLCALNTLAWGRQIFHHDFLNYKLTDDERDAITLQSSRCGHKYAVDLRRNRITLADKIAENGLIITMRSECDEHEAFFMGQFRPPNEISLFEQNIRLTMEIIKKYHQEKLLGGHKLEDIILAHEVFHSIEESDKNVYTRQPLLTLWKFGFLRCRVCMIAPGEIAAIAFAKEILDLPCNPDIFSYILLTARDPVRAQTMLEFLTGGQSI
jgi:hypothetical protein